jgi:hypothetical protein
MHSEGCIHSDLSDHQVLVKNGILRIVDFAFAVERGRDTVSTLVEKAKKTRCFIDDYIVEYIKFKLYGANTGSEPHCFVLWDASHYELFQSQLASQFDIVRAIVHLPNFFAHLGGDRDEILCKFYGGRTYCSEGTMGSAPFILYFVLDRQPRYGICQGSRNMPSPVNATVFDFKVGFQSACDTELLHGSETIQESFDNLEALTCHGEEIPKSYWLRWRPTFASARDFIHTLNLVKGLQYVFLGDYEDLLENNFGRKLPLCILINDYYLFKRVSGAIGYKHARPREASPAYEYGGYATSGHVAISGREISIDIRFVGDGYYCERWERSMLTRRVGHGCIFMPDAENSFYSLLYHALVHGPGLSKRDRQKICALAAEHGIESCASRLDGNLWECLDEFMAAKNYTYQRPKDLSISLSLGARVRMGITAENEMSLARTLATRDQRLEAADLLRALKISDPLNREARRLLRKLDKEARRSLFRTRLIELTRKTRLASILPKAIKNLAKKLISAT